jgi:hypothetical protein
MLPPPRSPRLDVDLGMSASTLLGSARHAQRLLLQWLSVIYESRRRGFKSHAALFWRGLRLESVRGRFAFLAHRGRAELA